MVWLELVLGNDVGRSQVLISSSVSLTCIHVVKSVSLNSGGCASPGLSLSPTECGKSVKATHFCRLWDSLRVKPGLDTSHHPTDCPRMESGPRLILPSIPSLLSRGHTGEV